MDGSSKFYRSVGANAESNVSSDENRLRLRPFSFYSLTLSSALLFGLRVLLARSRGDKADNSKGEATWRPSRENLANKR